MEAEQKLTPETFPDSPEKSTLEGKNKFIGFWLFLGEKPYFLLRCLQRI